MSETKMSAIEKINQKELVDMNLIENALWRLWTFGGQTFIAEQAAEGLAALIKENQDYLDWHLEQGKTITELRAESESRRVALLEKSEECRREWQRAEISINALEEIRNTQGKVCGTYEICDHASCSSSYNSWAIADKALRLLASSAPISEAKVVIDDADEDGLAAEYERRYGCQK